MAATGFMQWIGAGLQAEGIQQAARAQRKVALGSAKAAEKEGREARTQSRYEQRLIREMGAEMGGQIEVAAGKGSVAMSGTPLATLVKSARQVELAAAVTERTGKMEQDRYKAQA